MFAARSRGDSPPALGRLLTEAVLSSTGAEFGRLSHSRVDMDGSGGRRGRRGGHVLKRTRPGCRSCPPSSYARCSLPTSSPYGTPLPSLPGSPAVRRGPAAGAVLHRARRGGRRRRHLRPRSGAAPAGRHGGGQRPPVRTVRQAPQPVAGYRWATAVCSVFAPGASWCPPVALWGLGTSLRTHPPERMEHVTHPHPVPAPPPGSTRRCWPCSVQCPHGLPTIATAPD